MKLDFTISAYESLCTTIKKNGYKTLTVKDYLIKKPKQKFVILRHDVDRMPYNSLLMARLENKLGIKSTYYFRTTKSVFQPDIIKEIASLGHEIGFHYEVLDKTKGDYDKAFELFKEEIETLRKTSEIKTICMHGNPLSPWTNRDLWKKKNFKKLGVIGEAYLSIDFSDILYFTDTGRRWDGKYSVKDFVDAKNPYAAHTKDTEDLRTLFLTKKVKNACLTTHPQRWNNLSLPWLKELLFQTAKNVPKGVIKCLR